MIKTKTKKPKRLPELRDLLWSDSGVFGSRPPQHRFWFVHHFQLKMAIMSRPVAILLLVMLQEVSSNYGTNEGQFSFITQHAIILFFWSSEILLNHFE
jgi:hypothetical protein